jgi:hypothetical protein
MPEDIIGNSKATLLEVLFVGSKEELSKEFINYDTEYHQWNHFEKRIDINHFPLPKGALIVLILMINKPGANPFLFTTIQRHTPEKEKYYRELRGQTVDIKFIKEED